MQGDLGGIAPKYDCAVSTACGILDYIVTDTVDTGYKCLELLKQFDIGRGNFISLEQQQWLKKDYEKPFRSWVTSLLLDFIVDSNKLAYSASSRYCDVLPFWWEDLVLRNLQAAAVTLHHSKSPNRLTPESPITFNVPTYLR